jgi:hypothetical protein
MSGINNNINYDDEDWADIFDDSDNDSIQDDARVIDSFLSDEEDTTALPEDFFNEWQNFDVSENKTDDDPLMSDDDNDYKGDWGSDEHTDESKRDIESDDVPVINYVDSHDNNNTVINHNTNTQGNSQRQQAGSTNVDTQRQPQSQAATKNTPQDDSRNNTNSRTHVRPRERPNQKNSSSTTQENNSVPSETLPLDEILKHSVQKRGLNYANVLKFITSVDPSSVKGLATKYDTSVCKDDCDAFVDFVSEIFNAQSQRTVGIILSEVLSYVKKNAGVTFNVLDIIEYCNAIYKHVSSGKSFLMKDIGYTKIRIMVDNAFIIEYLSNNGVSANYLKVGNGVDDSVDVVIQLAVAVAYGMYGTNLGNIEEKYSIAFQRIKTEKPEMFNVVAEGDFEAFYKMLRTLGGSGTVGIDLRDIDLNIESYSQGEAAALYAAVIAKMDALSIKYHKNYDNEDVERVVDSIVSRGYRASQTNAIDYYCEEMMNPKKPIRGDNSSDVVNFDHGRNFATQAYIPAGYGLSNSHVEMSKPYTEVFGIPFINIRHSIFKTIAMKYSNKYSHKPSSNGKSSDIDKKWEKRVATIKDNADKAEKQLIKEIKKGSLMTRFLIGDKTKDTQVEGEGLGFMSSIEKGLRRVTSFASNPIIVKNILKLIKMAIDGEETPVSRNTLVVAANQMNSYERSPLISNDVNDQFAHVRVFNPVTPEKSAAVSKKYLKQFYHIVNPLENADEYIACGAFSNNLPSTIGGRSMFMSQMQTVSGGAIDPSSVSDAAITAFRQDIIAHNGYPYTYVLTDRFSGDNNQVYRIARHNNFFGNLMRSDVDLVAIHVKKAGIDGIFIMESHDAEVLFS